MASKVVASAPTLIGKLLRQRLHLQHNPLATAPFASASRKFCTGPPPPDSPDQPNYEPNPFLRTGEAGPCRVEKTEKECYMRIDVPGVAEEDMQVWSETGYIYFCAKDSKLPNYNYDGRVFGGAISFNPDRFDSDGVKAEVKNGVLWLAVPRVKTEE